MTHCFKTNRQTKPNKTHTLKPSIPYHLVVAIYLQNYLCIEVFEGKKQIEYLFTVLFDCSLEESTQNKCVPKLSRSALSSHTASSLWFCNLFVIQVDSFVPIHILSCIPLTSLLIFKNLYTLKPMAFNSQRCDIC